MAPNFRRWATAPSTAICICDLKFVRCLSSANPCPDPNPRFCEVSINWERGSFREAWNSMRVGENQISIHEMLGQGLWGGAGTDASVFGGLGTLMCSRRRATLYFLTCDGSCKTELLYSWVMDSRVAMPQVFCLRQPYNIAAW